MDWKKFGKRLLFPPVWLGVIMALVSGALLILVFVKGWEETPLAYGVYALSAYAVTAATALGIVVVPGKLQALRQRWRATSFGSRYASDRDFRTKISLYVSFGISILYVLINVWSWHLLHSWWFVVLAVYYVIMAVMRFLLMRYVRKNALGKSLLEEWRRSRLCAHILLLVNLSLSGAVLMILFQNRGYDYPGMMIYVMALYTFYSTIHAVVDIVKYRRLGSPVLSAAKIVSLSSALVSMLNLETAMFAQFGADMAKEDQDLMIILTGAGVSLTVVTLSVVMIVKATKNIRREKNGN